MPTSRHAVEYIDQKLAHGGNRQFWQRVREHVSSMPAQLGALSTPPDRTCSTCGAAITGSEWDRMPVFGFQVIPAWKDEPGEVLELKNHSCGSTLARLAPFSPEDLEYGAEVELQRGVGDLKTAQRVAAANLEQNPRYYRG